MPHVHVPSQTSRPIPDLPRLRGPAVCRLCGLAMVSRLLCECVWRQVPARMWRMRVTFVRTRRLSTIHPLGPRAPQKKDIFSPFSVFSPCYRNQKRHKTHFPPTSVFMLRLLQSIFSHEKLTIRKFPGSLPVALEKRKDIEALQRGYVVSRKADGERCFLWIARAHNEQNPRVWTVARDMSVRKLVWPNKVPNKATSSTSSSARHDVDAFLTHSIIPHLDSRDGTAMSTRLLEVNSVTYSTPRQPIGGSSSGGGGRHRSTFYVFDVEVLPSTGPGTTIVIFDTLVYDTVSLVKVCYRLRHLAGCNFVRRDITTVFPGAAARSQRIELDPNTPSLQKHRINRPDTGGGSVMSRVGDDVRIVVKPIYLTSAIRELTTPRAAPPKTESEEQRALLLDAFKGLMAMEEEEEEEKEEEKEKIELDDDGLIFTRLLCAYRPFRLDKHAIIKYKPVHLITIDLRVVGLDEVPEPSTFVTSYIAGVNPQYTTRTVGDTVLSCTGLGAYKQLYLCKMSNLPNVEPNSIVEVRWAADQWVYVGERPHKLIPNTVKTVVGTIKSIESNITYKDLVK